MKLYHPLRKIVGRERERERDPTFDDFLKKLGRTQEQYQSFADSIAIGSTTEGVVTPFDGPSYEIARSESDPAFNTYPYLIAYCSCVSDVISAVKFARMDPQIKVCIRAGGHNTAGYSTIQNGMIIDVSGMNGIIVDTEKKEAIFQAGVRWGKANKELQIYNLHTPGGGCDDVGIAGFSMGGGYGYTAMKYGMACDNIIEVTMVTADGKIVKASEGNDPDKILWAIKGGTGGNFGVVVDFKFRLYDIPLKVYPISLNWKIDYAAQILTTWQNQMTMTLKDRNLGILGFLAVEGEDDGMSKRTPYFCIRGIYSGTDPEAGKAALKPLLDIGNPVVPAGNPPLFSAESMVSYADANQHLLDNVENTIPSKAKETKRCAYIERQLSQDEYQLIVDYFTTTTPSIYNLVSMEPYGGRINEIAPGDCAFVHRKEYFDIFVDSFWVHDEEEKTARDWLHTYFEDQKFKNIWSTHIYQNYMNSEYTNWEEAYFGENYHQLQIIKSKLDPKYFFSYQQGIRPLPPPST